MSTKEQKATELFFEIVNCKNVKKACKDPTHACYKVVNQQSSQNRQVPEPWTGDLLHAPILFVSSNPSIGKDDEVFPTLSKKRDWPKNRIQQFFYERFTGGCPKWTDDGLRYLRRKKNRRFHYGKKGDWVRYWGSVRSLASKILNIPKECVRPGVHYALTEIVRCKSKNEVGVSCAADACANKFLRRTLRLSPALLIVVNGSIASDAIRSLIKLQKRVKVKSNVMLESKKRTIVFLPHPSSFGPKQLTPKEIKTIQKSMKMKTYFFLFAFLVLFESTASAQWQETSGPSIPFFQVDTVWDSTNYTLDTVTKYLLSVHSMCVVGSKIFAGGDYAWVTSDDGDSWFLPGTISNVWNDTSANLRIVHCIVPVSTYLFAGTDGGMKDTVGGIFRSSDTGATWSRVANGFRNVNALAASGNNIFAGTDSGVYVSTNNGSNWSPGFRQVHVNAIAAQGSKVFAGTASNGLIISTNNGLSWSASGSSLPITNVQSLAVKGGILFAGTNGNGLFLSKDTGTTWTDVSNGLPSSSVYALEENSAQFFAGTDGGGIYRTDDSGATWKEVDSGLSDLKVTSLAIRNGNLFAGTIGGGVWERPLSQMLIVAHNDGVAMNSRIAGISAFPDPISTSTTIRFTAGESGFADIRIVNPLGIVVAEIFSGELQSGDQSFKWLPGNLPRGIYECVIAMANQKPQHISLLIQ